MPKKPRDWLQRLLVMVAILLFALVPLYAVAYLVTGSRTTGGPTEFQGFHHKWQCILFLPAVKIESAIRQQPIDTGWKTDLSQP